MPSSTPLHTKRFARGGVRLAALWSTAKKVVGQAQDDQLTMMASSIAFYSMLAFVPALVAVVSTYGLFAAADDVKQQLELIGALMPPGAARLLGEQLESIASSPHGGLSLSLVISTLVMLWSASSAVDALLQGVDYTHRKGEMRTALRRRGIAVVITIASIVLFPIAFALVAIIPHLLRALHLGALASLLIELGRWPALAVVVTVGLRALYRHGPQRKRADARPKTAPGILLATLCWLVASVGFSIYVQYFGRYNEIYGALSSVVVLLLWLWIGALSVLLGAELNAILEQERDSR